MNNHQTAFWLAVFGIPFFGRMPPGGFREGYKLLKEYKAIKAESGEPDLNQKDAYYTFTGYKIGSVFFFLSLIYFVASLLSGE